MTTATSGIRRNIIGDDTPTAFKHSAEERDGGVHGFTAQQLYNWHFFPKEQNRCLFAFRAQRGAVSCY
jgi:hypothetical protein